MNGALSALSPESETRQERRVRERRERVAAIHDAMRDHIPTVLVNMIAEYDI